MSRRSKRRQADVQLHIRLYPGQDDELLRWLEQFEVQPYGVKTQAVKEALLRSIDSASRSAGRSALDPAVELSGQSLAEIRRVIEAAVETSVARLACTLQGEGRIGTAAVAEEDDETEGLLDALGEALVLKG